MTTIRTVTSRNRRGIVALLLPVMLVIFGKAYLQARGQYSVPAHVVSIHYQPAAPQAAEGKERAMLPLRSVSHPFALPISEREAEFVMLDQASPSFPVAAGDQGAWYSAGVNRISSSLLLPTVTWLGTDFGLKRLDNRTRIVQHFCTLDGLPYNRITALGGQEAQLYCCAAQITTENPLLDRDETKPHRSAFALCRYHADSGRWEAVADEMRSYPQGVHVNVPEASKAVSKYETLGDGRAERQFVTVGGDHACLVVGPGLPDQGLALVSPIKGGNAEKVFCPSFAKAPFRISFAQADADNLWIGSDLGLLRYDFKAHRWERLLSDLVVTGGCPAPQGGLWLLTQRFDPVHQDKDGNNVQTEHWQITRFVQGKAPEHFAVTDHENHARETGASISFTNIVAVRDQVWTTQQRFVMAGHGQFSYYPAVYVLDLPTRQVTLTAPFGSGERQYDPVPDAALANALTGWRVPVPLRMTTRFSGWICPPEEKDRARFALPAPAGGYLPNSADGHWHTQGESGSGPGGSFSRQVLIRGGQPGDEGERYIFPTFSGKTHDPVSAPALLKGKVYFLSGQRPMRLYAWDRTTDQLTPVPELDAALAQYRPDWGADRLRSDGTSLWIGTGKAVLRYNGQTKQVDAWNGDPAQAGSWAEPYTLLTAAGGKAWIKGAPNRLYTVGDSASDQMVPVALPPFPADVEQDPAEAALFAMEDGIAWFRTKSAAIPRHPVTIGFKTSSRTWTKAHEGTVPLSSAAASIPIVKQGSTQWFYGEQNALGFNTETGQWQTLPRIPVAMNVYTPLLTAVDAQNAWVVSDAKLLHLDRAHDTWTAEEMPFSIFPYQTPTGIRDGSSLLVPTQRGLWSIDLTTKQRKQSPGLQSKGQRTNFSVVATDRNAVWVVGGSMGDGFLIRFDRKAHTWSAIPPQEGIVIPQYNGAQWIGDGESCWLRTDGDTYRLNRKTNRWENISARLAADQSRPGFQQIVPDGDDVWLVAATRDARYVPLPHPPAIPLYRYHVTTGMFDPVQPAGAPLMPHYLTVNRNSALLAAVEGDYRFDRAANRWNPVPLPTLPIGFPHLEAQAVYEEAGNYWYIGTDNGLRLKR